MEKGTRRPPRKVECGVSGCWMGEGYRHMAKCVCGTVEGTSGLGSGGGKSLERRVPQVSLAFVLVVVTRVSVLRDTWALDREEDLERGGETPRGDEERRSESGMLVAGGVDLTLACARYPVSPRVSVE